MKYSLILGYGSTGQDIEKFLISKNKKYYIYDDYKTVPKEFTFELSDITNLENIFVSPGIKKDHEIINLAEEKNINLTSDIQYFNEISKVKIVGITGTNGKTSFVTLLDKILKKHGYKSKVAGNIGNSPLNLISDKENLDFLILELSSFQLSHLTKLDLEISVVLNIYEDHIDWHSSFENYATSKLKIFNFTKNNKNRFLGPVDNQLKKTNLLPRNVNVIKDMEAYFLPNYFDDFVSMFIKICSRFKIAKNEVIDFLSSEPSVEHRFELFITKNGVNFINDSKSTNLESVNKASFKVKNCMLVMHGLSKGIGSNKLDLSNEVKKILIPKDSEFDLSKYSKIITEYDSFDELNTIIKTNYKDYETILFSCGGSSFSDFDNYKDRGNYFKKMIESEI
ncbi:MAG: Mur ligase family protein [Candidatus Actinomarina sp.]|tara:strand:- start:2 stop:1186 length:1185 start_codon:yes stop_codon:yes gene_type:complete